MKLYRPTARKRFAESAYTLVEVMIAVLALAIMGAALYGGFWAGFSTIRTTRENLRATQILLERTETIRLYRWDQVTNSGFIPPGFTNYFYPEGLASGGSGIMYTGTVSIAPAPASLPAAYRDNMKQVSVHVAWVSGKELHQHDAMTYVARYGLQNYVYSPTNNF